MRVIVIPARTQQNKVNVPAIADIDIDPRYP
jgi:hypothetical protein